MREAYLTGVVNEPKKEPKPATLAEALAGIERSLALKAEAQAIKDKIKADTAAEKARELKLWNDSGNFPYMIFEALGYEPGQVRREIATGKEWIVISVNPSCVNLQGITSRGHVGRALGRRIYPLKWRDFEDTGRRVKALWSATSYNPFAGAYVQKAAPDEKPLPFPELASQ